LITYILEYFIVKFDETFSIINNDTTEINDASVVENNQIMEVSNFSKMEEIIVVASSNENNRNSDDSNLNDAKEGTLHVHSVCASPALRLSEQEHDVHVQKTNCELYKKQKEVKAILYEKKAEAEVQKGVSEALRLASEALLHDIPFEL
jgi:hypothetical protein